MSGGSDAAGAALIGSASCNGLILQSLQANLAQRRPTRRPKPICQRRSRYHHRPFHTGSRAFSANARGPSSVFRQDG
ncbi:hypothetical protein KCP75_25015 [Salmonella enterica subsp. enterica]|nr:hypothetical protein KCP75_25015 [Salmonella enterica subsp. enterica]